MTTEARAASRTPGPPAAGSGPIDQPLGADGRGARGLVAPPSVGRDDATLAVLRAPEWRVEARPDDAAAVRDSLAQAWRRWRTMVSRWLDPVTEMMLDLAGVGHGCRVLDVAAGAGGQTLLAARRAGPPGYVLATDVCQEMLSIAAEVLYEAGSANAATVAMDAQDLSVPAGAFDAAICRMGLMYVPSPMLALAEMRRALKPGGKAAVVVLSVPENNALLTVPNAVLCRRMGRPPPPADESRAFGLARPGALERAFSRAGYRDVDTQVVDAPLRAASAAECVRFQRDVFTGGGELLWGLTEDDRRTLWNDVAQAMHQFEHDGGCEVPCELMLGVGSN